MGRIGGYSLAAGRSKPRMEGTEVSPLWAARWRGYSGIQTNNRRESHMAKSVDWYYQRKG